jgi:hypothetical protein
MSLEQSIDMVRRHPNYTKSHSRVWRRLQLLNVKPSHDSRVLLPEKKSSDIRCSYKFRVGLHEASRIEFLVNARQRYHTAKNLMATVYLACQMD